MRELKPMRSKSARKSNHKRQRIGSPAWQRFVIGAVGAAEQDARRRKRYKPRMSCLYQGRRIAYSVTNLSRVLVYLDGLTVGGWYGEL